MMPLFTEIPTTKSMDFVEYFHLNVFFPLFFLLFVKVSWQLTILSDRVENMNEKEITSLSNIYPLKKFRIEV